MQLEPQANSAPLLNMEKSAVRRAMFIVQSQIVFKVAGCKKAPARLLLATSISYKQSFHCYKYCAPTELWFSTVEAGNFV